MNTNTIQVAATAAIVLTLVLGVLGTSPSTPNGVSHFNTSEKLLRTDGHPDTWSWVLKPPLRINDNN